MELWKKQIRRLVYDFVLPTALYKKIINATEIELKHAKIPGYYTGIMAENNYKYDVAYRKLLPHLKNI